MSPETFTTQFMSPRDQHEAWREWFRPVFEVTLRDPGAVSFPARNTVWKLDNLVVSRVSAPAVRVRRTPIHIRRNPIDHWVLSWPNRDQNRKGHVASPSRCALPVVAGRGIRGRAYRHGTATGFSAARCVLGHRAGAGRCARRRAGYTARNVCSATSCFPWNTGCRAFRS